MEIKEVRDMKGTKDRLDELQDLLQASYITENEYRVARLNALREGGIDIVTRPQEKEEEEKEREEEKEEKEEEEKSKGCGCFLTSVFLIVFLTFGAILAIPNWPESFGGSYVQAGRQWILALFFSEEPNLASDLVPSVILPSMTVVAGSEKNVQQGSTSPALSSNLSSNNLSSDLPLSEFSLPERIVSGESLLNVLSGLEVSSLPPAPETASYAEPVLPPLDARIFSLPDMGDLDSVSPSTPQEPDVMIIEVSPRRNQKIEEGLQRGVVSGRSVRLRSAPDTSRNDNIIGWGTNGDRFWVLEKGAARDGSTWYRIRYEVGDKQGWISGSLVTLEK
ncbi:MAG: SH3 domain-containing protein [Synergistaceae bacterium]|jgi:hypothetical protein|nr:SH3 domain-containing protein [Synergistaceae bacterium]